MVDIHYIPCGIIVPRQYGLLFLNEFEGYTAECIRGRHHDGPHVFRTPNGELVSWEMDWGCDCNDEECECYLYGFIEEGEIPISG